MKLKIIIQRTALHIAVDKKNHEIVKLLLAHKSIDKTVKDKIFNCAHEIISLNL